MVRGILQMLAQALGLLWEWWEESWWQAPQLPTSYGNDFLNSEEILLVEFLGRVICANIIEVQTTSSEGLHKQENESSPPSAWQHQSAHQSSHYRGIFDNGMDSCPSSSLLPWFSTFRLPYFWLPEGCSPRTLFGRWLSWNTARIKRINISGKSIILPAYCISHKGGKSLDNEGDCVEK
jgi:hypothetical protein